MLSNDNTACSKQGDVRRSSCEMRGRFKKVGSAASVRDFCLEKACWASRVGFANTSRLEED